jgi:hypothetical protein
MRNSWRRTHSSWQRQVVTTVSAVSATDSATAVAVVAIVVAVAARIIVNRRHIPRRQVRIVAIEVRIVGTITVGVAVILALSHVIFDAPYLLRSIPRRTPLSEHRDYYTNYETRAETCPTNSRPNHFCYLTKSVVRHPHHRNGQILAANRPKRSRHRFTRFVSCHPRKSEYHLEAMMVLKYGTAVSATSEMRSPPRSCSHTRSRAFGGYRQPRS